MKLLIITTMFFLSMIMFFITNPMLMGLNLLILTILTSLLMSFMTNSYWFSYILILIFLGAMMVLFMYVISLTSNNKYKINYYTMINLIIIIILFYLFLYNNMFMYNLHKNMDMNLMNYNYLFFNNENKINMNKIYNMQSFFLTMLLIIYLLITLIALVKIINIFYGPLRKMN